MRSNLIFLLLTFLICFDVSAQNKGKKSSDKEKEPKSEIIDVFGKEADSPSNANRRSPENEIDMRNMLKFELLELVNGNLVLNYERVLTNRLGVELGIGTKFSNNILNSFAEELFDEELIYGKANYGPYFSGQIKYYTDNYDAPEGIYVSLGTRFSSITFEPAKDNSFNEYSTKSSKRLDLLSLGCGGINIWDRFVSEYYIKVGLKKNTVVDYDYSIPGKYTVSDPVTESKVFFTIGYKIGIYF
ncbi:MAG: hypothetical protein IPQ02_11465 [Saprospiraceae bacterium]|nr:hypothetical protein [Candidatus Defluviibacterium haderslevense]